MSYKKQTCILFFSMLIFVCFISLTGCSSKSEKYNGYYVYYVDTNETKVVGEKYTIKNKNVNKIIHELIGKLSDDPEDISLKKTIPDTISMDEYTLNSSGDLCIYWSISYSNQTGVSEILRRAAIVKTLCQVPAINTIEFYVAGQPLTDDNMNAIGFMTADSFIDNTGKDVYTQKATITLYFADSTGKELEKNTVKTKYDATIPIEQLVIQKLIKGPEIVKKKNTMQKTVPSGTKINKISVKDYTCYIDLSNEFLDKRENITEDVTIYSVVNTLVSLPHINKVVFTIEGEPQLLYNDKVQFSDPFEINLDIVK